VKIGVVNDHFSLGPGGQHRIQNLALGLSELGHDILYITSYGISANLSDLLVSKEPSYNRLTFDQYLSPYFDEFFKIYKSLNKVGSKLDVLLIELPNTLSKSLNAIYALSKKIPVFYDFGGLWTSFLDKGKIYGTGQLRLNLMRPFSQLYEDSLAICSSRLPDALTVPTSGMNLFYRRYLRRSAYVVYQPVDTSLAFNPSLVYHDETLESIPEKYKHQRLVAIGVKGDEWFVPFIEKLIRKCKGENVAFMVIGNFPKAEMICAKKGLEDYVYFTGNIPYYILSRYIALIEFSIVLTYPALVSIWYAPHNIAKIVDYMAMGKPIITDTVAAVDYVQNNKTGFLISDQAKLLDKTILLLKDHKLVSRMGNLSREIACEKFSHVKVAKHYTQLIEQASRKKQAMVKI
jgi:glycosyltransferase involved in cell wall biosynthesis